MIEIFNAIIKIFRNIVVIPVRKYGISQMNNLYYLKILIYLKYFLSDVPKKLTVSAVDDDGGSNFRRSVLNNFKSSPIEDWFVPIIRRSFLLLVHQVFLNFQARSPISRASSSLSKLQNTESYSSQSTVIPVSKKKIVEDLMQFIG